jgi:hypothetical protein
MQRILLLCSFVIALSNLVAQNVGIGIATPNSKAQLDISSTTRGLLPPRMTTAQRFAITTPPAGLMVYDTDKEEFYHYNSSNWTAILNGTYWSRPITSRNRIANANDSVGIGTVSPTEWLDVDGNIRSRNNLMVDNAVLATGTVIGGSFATGGNIFAGGVATISGITSSSTVILSSEFVSYTVTGGLQTTNLVTVDAWDTYFEDYYDARFNFIIYK